MIPEKTSFTQEMEVGVMDTAIYYKSGALEVFGTPGLIAFMENTACKTIETFLPEEQTSVGIEIQVKHVKATPVGGIVHCESKLVQIEGKRLFFEVKAWDEKGLIGEGTHIRYIVEKKRFMEGLSK